MNALVYSSSLIAAFLGGVLALFAPCCIVSLMPAYLAAALRRGPWRLIGMTALFTAGVALVLLPVVLGIGALSEFFGIYHREVDFVVGVILATLGIFALSGQGWMLPVPMLQTPTGWERGNASSVLLLGAISGVASSCCAPVLVGVLALSALAPSVLTAAGLGLAYVFGMVFPLLLAAILWERLKLDSGAIARVGLRRVAIGSWSAKVTDVVGGGIFLAMGVAALALAYTGQSTYTPDVLLGFNRWATSAVANVVMALNGIPLGLQAMGLLAILGAVVWLAWRRPLEAARATAFADQSEHPEDRMVATDQAELAVPEPGRRSETVVTITGESPRRERSG